MVKTAVLVSGGGLNLQSLIDASAFGDMPECELAAVISSVPDAYAVKRAQMASIPVYIIDRDMFPNVTSFGSALLDKLRDLDIELVVLSGFDTQLTQPVYKSFFGRIMTTYPALLPAFPAPVGEEEKALQMQLDAGVKVSGATAYFVREDETGGPIILQKAVEVMQDDTPSTLAQRILEEGENVILPKAVDLYCRGLLSVENGIVHIEKKPENG